MIISCQFNYLSQFRVVVSRTNERLILCCLARIPGHQVIIAGTAKAASAVALRPSSVRDLSRQSIELDRMHQVIKTPSLVTVDCA